MIDFRILNKYRKIQQMTRKIKRFILSCKKRLNVMKTWNQIFESSYIAEKSALKQRDSESWIVEEYDTSCNSYTVWKQNDCWTTNQNSWTVWKSIAWWCEKTTAWNTDVEKLVWSIWTIQRRRHTVNNQKILSSKKYQMTEQETLWCLWTWETETDYLLNDWDIDCLPPLFVQDDLRFEYNQQKQTRSTKSCTIFSAIWALSDLMNYEFSLDEIKEIDDLSYTKWRLEWQWRYTKKAVDLVAKRRNSNEELVKKYWKVAYYRVNKYSEKLDEILQKKYALATNFCPTVEYRVDYWKDAILDWCEFWTQTNWHAIDVIRNVHKRSTKDSYKWRKATNWADSNRYELKHRVCELTNYATRLYIYTKVREDNFERVKELNELKSLLTQTIVNNSAMRHKTNDSSFKKALNEMNIKNRKKLQDVDEQLKLLR